MDELIPSEGWAECPDLRYDIPCPTCAALVENRKVHRAWHIALVEQRRAEGG